ncbi:MAG: porin [Hyphomicrobiales bacterium]|nr:porin [Hyphomicrobiales bacterium]
MATNRQIKQKSSLLGGIALTVVLAAPTAAVADDDLPSAGTLGSSAVSRLDYGGGYVMGSLLTNLDPSLTGGRNSGLITSRFQPIRWADGRGQLRFYGDFFNNGWLNVDNNNPDNEKSTFSTNGAQDKVLGARLSYDLTDDLKFGVIGALSGAINRSDILNDYSDGDAGCNVRHPDRVVCPYAASFFVKSRTFGKISLGLGETASADIGDINLGGIAYVTDSNPTVKAGWHEAWGLGRRFNDIALDSVGVTRASRIRYDSPTIAGFVLSGSWGDADYTGAPDDAQNYWDVALRYAGEFGAFRVASGVGYQDYDRRGDKLDQANLTGAASIMHTPTGLYVSGSVTGSTRDAPFDTGVGEKDSASAYYLQGGLGQGYFTIGKTTVYGEYGETNGGANAGAYFLKESSTNNWGVGIVQNIDAAAMSIYLTYNQIDAKVAGVKSDDIDVVFAGARIRF